MLHFTPQISQNQYHEINDYPTLKEMPLAHYYDVDRVHSTITGAPILCGKIAKLPSGTGTRASSTQTSGEQEK